MLIVCYGTAGCGRYLEALCSFQLQGVWRLEPGNRYPGAGLPGLPGTWLPGHPVTWLPGYPGTPAPGFRATQAPVCPATPVPGLAGSRAPAYPPAGLPVSGHSGLILINAVTPLYCGPYAYASYALRMILRDR